MSFEQLLAALPLVPGGGAYELQGSVLVEVEPPTAEPAAQVPQEEAGTPPEQAEGRQGAAVGAATGEPPAVLEDSVTTTVTPTRAAKRGQA